RQGRDGGPDDVGALLDLRDDDDHGDGADRLQYGHDHGGPSAAAAREWPCVAGKVNRRGWDAWFGKATGWRGEVFSFCLRESGAAGTDFGAGALVSGQPYGSDMASRAYWKGHLRLSLVTVG